MLRKITMISSFVACTFFGVALAQQQPVTDGLKWDTDMPKVVAGAKANQIKLNGLVDSTTYPMGAAVVADTITYKIFVYTVQGGRGEKLDEGTLDVTGLTSWTGTTKRRGGFPAGSYSIEISTEQFRETTSGNTRKAILKKEPFEIK